MKPTAWAAAAALVILSGAPALAQLADPLASCTSVQSCTALIDGGGLSQTDLARTLSIRANFAPDGSAATMADLDRAIAILRAARGHNHDLGMALYVRSRNNEARSDLQQQIADLTEAMRVDPSLPFTRTLVLAYEDLGRQLFHNGDSAGAIEAETRALSYEHEPNAYVLRADIHRARGENALAAADYNSALAIAPNYAYPRQQLAAMQQAQQQAQAAAQQRQMAQNDVAANGIRGDAAECIDPAAARWQNRCDVKVRIWISWQTMSGGLVYGSKQFDPGEYEGNHNDWLSREPGVRIIIACRGQGYNDAYIEPPNWNWSREPTSVLHCRGRQPG
jgi:tetratricopeptide (TPR) repeat protein